MSRRAGWGPSARGSSNPIDTREPADAAPGSQISLRTAFLMTRLDGVVWSMPVNHYAIFIMDIVWTQSSQVCDVPAVC